METVQFSLLQFLLWIRVDSDTFTNANEAVVSYMCIRRYDVLCVFDCVLHVTDQCCDCAVVVRVSRACGAVQSVGAPSVFCSLL